jgi:hypothetical protein
MIPYKSYLATAVPETFDLRLEILKAARALAATLEDERLRQPRAALASVRRELGEIALALHELGRESDPRLRSYVLKYNPDEQRVPAGNPDGGQWTSGDTEEVESGDDTTENLDQGIAPATESGGNQEQDTESADVQSIVDTAKQLNAAASPNAYQQCLELCYPLLERPPGPRRDGNYWDFIRCMNACLGRNL